jgi:hypothetical protein
MARKTTAAVGDRSRPRRVPSRWIYSGPAGGGANAPAWLDLPTDAREALVGLMTQLILAHARTSVTPSAAGESGHDR